MIIDFHTHIFPDALAKKALDSLQATAKLPVCFDGTADGLCELLERDGIGAAVVLNTATNAHQVGKVNDFCLATARKYEQLIPFCSLHPESESPYETLEALTSQGIKGIKLHPDYVRTELDDPSFYPILDAASELSLPVVIHAGFDPVSPDKMHATPQAILRTVKRFPRLTLIAAHLGGVSMWDEVAEVLCGTENLYLDTAFCCERVGITPEQAKRIISKHPAERILFGSDAPWASAREVLEFLGKAEISDSKMELITEKNAKELLSLDY